MPEYPADQGKRSEPQVAADDLLHDQKRFDGGRRWPSTHCCQTGCDGLNGGELGRPRDKRAMAGEWR